MWSYSHWTMSGSTYIIAHYSACQFYFSYLAYMKIPQSWHVLDETTDENKHWFEVQIRVRNIDRLYAHHYLSWMCINVILSIAALWPGVLSSHQSAWMWRMKRPCLTLMPCWCGLECVFRVSYHLKPAEKRIKGKIGRIETKYPQYKKQTLM